MFPKRFFFLTVLLISTCLLAESGHIGVAFATVPSDAPMRGVLIKWIAPDGPASAAGLQTGDLVRAINGHAVSTPREAANFVFSHHPGEVLTFDVLRQGASGPQETRIKVRLGSPSGGHK